MHRQQQQKTASTLSRRCRKNTAVRSTPPLPSVESMRVGDIRSELESYGVSTKSFLEKKELISALIQARKDGMQSNSSAAQKQSTSSTKSSESVRSTRSSSSSKSSPSSSPSRDDRLKEEIAKAASMSVSELRKQLMLMGVSTKTFFEKTEFMKAYAEAIVDGANVNGSAGAATEQFDASYRDVVVQKLSKADPRLSQGTVIDISLR